METWWNSLDMVDKLLWCITLCATLIFAVQTVMTFLGMDADGDFDVSGHDASGSESEPFQLFTFRNLINFILGFGWTFIVVKERIENEFFQVVIAVWGGIILVALVMFIFKVMSKQQQSGNIDINNAIGKTANVYLTIPGNEGGMGKVQMSIQGAVREYDAITKDETIKTGQIVKIVDVVDKTCLLVEKIPL